MIINRFKWLEGLASAVIELAKELNILKPVCMNIGTEKIYGKIKYMSENKYNYEYYSSDNCIPLHAGHHIYNVCDNSCRKTKRQKS